MTTLAASTGSSVEQGGIAPPGAYSGTSGTKGILGQVLCASGIRFISGLALLAVLCGYGCGTKRGLTAVSPLAVQARLIANASLPASAETIEPPCLSCPSWATNELPLQSFRVIDPVPPFTSFLLATSVVIPTNRIPLRLSLQFRHSDPYDAWIEWVSVTNDGFIGRSPPFYFCVPVNELPIDNGLAFVRVLAD